YLLRSSLPPCSIRLPAKFRKVPVPSQIPSASPDRHRVHYRQSIQGGLHSNVANPGESPIKTAPADASDHARQQIWRPDLSASGAFRFHYRFRSLRADKHPSPDLARESLYPVSDRRPCHASVPTPLDQPASVTSPEGCSKHTRDHSPARSAWFVQHVQEHPGRPDLLSGRLRS